MISDYRKISDIISSPSTDAITTLDSELYKYLFNEAQPTDSNPLVYYAKISNLQKHE